MPGLSRLLSLLNRGLYDDDPIYRRRMRDMEIELPDLMEEQGDDGRPRLVSGPRSAHTVAVPDELEEVGRTNRRPSAAGRALRAAPSILRGALDGMSAYRTGDTVDMFGGMQAGLQGAEERDMIAQNRQRQARQDQMNEEMQQARMEEYRAQAERERAQAATAGQPRTSGKQQVPLAVRIAEKEQALGRKLTEREKLTESGLMGPGYDKRQSTVPQKVSGVIAQQMAGLDKDSPAYPEDFERLNKQYNEALQREQGSDYGQARKPFIRPQLTTGANRERLWIKAPDLKPGETKSVGDPEGKPVSAPAPTIRPPKTTASDKRYSDQQTVNTVIPRMEQSFKEAQARYPGLTREQFADNILNPEYFKDIPMELRRPIQIAFIGKSQPQKKGGVKTGRPAGAAPTQQKDPLGIR